MSLKADKATVLADFPKARAVCIPRHYSWRIYFNVLPRGVDDRCCIYCATEADAWATAARGCRTDRAWVERMQNAKLSSTHAARDGVTSTGEAR